MQWCELGRVVLVMLFTKQPPLEPFNPIVEYYAFAEEPNGQGATEDPIKFVVVAPQKLCHGLDRQIPA